jgi:hypothetical protein
MVLLSRNMIDIGNNCISHNTEQKHSLVIIQEPMSSLTCWTCCHRNSNLEYRIQICAWTFFGVCMIKVFTVPVCSEVILNDQLHKDGVSIQHFRHYLQIVGITKSIFCGYNKYSMLSCHSSSQSLMMETETVSETLDTVFLQLLPQKASLHPFEIISSYHV